MNNLIKTLIQRMAMLTGTELTGEHHKVLNYAYDYYQKNKVGPLFYNLKKNLNTSKEDVERLFPHGLNSVYTWIGIPIHSPNNSCIPIADFKVDDFRHVYLDHCATTYLRDEIKDLISRFNNDRLAFGNPSSSSLLGKNAYELISTARYQIADCLKVNYGEIIFTGSGTEANNLAIKGIAFKYLEKKGHIITNKIEHSSVLETLHWLQNIGFDVTYLDVDSDGFVSPENIKRHIKQNTILVAVMTANNEIGTIQPINEIGEICKTEKIPFFTDAVQAFGKIKLRPKESGISMMSLSAHKIYGPKGIGALYIDESLTLTPVLHGGKQEFGLRAGTENVSSIITFGKAAKLIHEEMEGENKRITNLNNYFLSGLQKLIPGFHLNGSKYNRLPQILSIGFPLVDSGALLLGLNKAGIYVSSGSACNSGSNEYSHVLSAIGLERSKYGTIRFSFGLKTTTEDLNYVLKYLSVVLDQLVQ